MNVFTSVTDPNLIALIRRGAVGVLLTDTVYGLVARADNEAAVLRLYALKDRERKPGSSIAASVEQLEHLGLPKRYLDRVAHLWPNPVSVVIPHDLAYIHQGLGDSPFRVVADSQLRTLLEQTGPLTTSSANHPGQPPAQNIQEAIAYFGDNVDFYVDGGETGERPSSTVVRIDDSGITLFREGAVKINEKGEIA